MEKLLSYDNIAILVLVLWIIEMKRMNLSQEKRMDKQWEIVDKFAEAINKIKYVLQIDQSMEFHRDKFTKN